ncbi:MAG: hypothetical protein JJW01_01140 [Alphaproteobacteria bacterium]|nr:hypothetical protein [Rickettsiales bacterium]
MINFSRIDSLLVSLKPIKKNSNVKRAELNKPKRESGTAVKDNLTSVASCIADDNYIDIVKTEHSASNANINNKHVQNILHANLKNTEVGEKFFANVADKNTEAQISNIDYDTNIAKILDEERPILKTVPRKISPVNSSHIKNINYKTKPTKNTIPILTNDKIIPESHINANKEETIEPKQEYNLEEKQTQYFLQKQQNSNTEVVETIKERLTNEEQTPLMPKVFKQASDILNQHIEHTENQNDATVTNMDVAVNKQNLSDNKEEKNDTTLAPDDLLFPINCPATKNGAQLNTKTETLDMLNQIENMIKNSSTTVRITLSSKKHNEASNVAKEDNQSLHYAHQVENCLTQEQENLQQKHKKGLCYSKTYSINNTSLGNTNFTYSSLATSSKQLTEQLTDSSVNLDTNNVNTNADERIASSVNTNSITSVCEENNPIKYNLIKNLLPSNSNLIDRSIVTNKSSVTIGINTDKNNQKNVTEHSAQYNEEVNNYKLSLRSRFGNSSGWHAVCNHNIASKAKSRNINMDCATYKITPVPLKGCFNVSILSYNEGLKTVFFANKDEDNIEKLITLAKEEKNAKTLYDSYNRRFVLIANSEQKAATSFFASGAFAFAQLKTNSLSNFRVAHITAKCKDLVQDVNNSGVLIKKITSKDHTDDSRIDKRSNVFIKICDICKKELCLQDDPNCDNVASYLDSCETLSSNTLFDV